MLVLFDDVLLFWFELSAGMCWMFSVSFCGCTVSFSCSSITSPVSHISFFSITLTALSRRFFSEISIVGCLLFHKVFILFMYPGFGSTFASRYMS